jgi:integrase
VFPRIGDTAITELKPVDALRIFHRIEAKGSAVRAHKTLQIVGQVFRLAVIRGEVDSDITRDLRGQLPSLPRSAPLASVPLAELPGLLRAIDGYDGYPVTRLALKIASLTVLRSKEFGHATWDEFEGLDGEAPLWRVPEGRMKMRRPHIVPLSPQTVAVLKELLKLSGGSGYVFPSPHRVCQPISGNSILFALHRLGYRGRQTTHGFRHIFSTVLNERGFNPDWIERQLAHEEGRKVRRAYNAAEYLPGRREMLTWWASYLDEQRALAGLR